MANKPDQGPNWKLPMGTAHTLTPDGGKVVSDYGKKPVSDRFNMDRGDCLPRDPQRPLKK